MSHNISTHGYRRVLLFDTSIGSENLGDEIIMDAVNRVVAEIIPFAHILRVATHLPLGFSGKRLIHDVDAGIVGGTNLLSSHMLSYAQWKIDIVDALLLSNVYLLGVGWWSYQKPPDIYTRRLLRSALGKSLLHSVRDTYTLAKLNAAGIPNVLNTGCPTLWQIDEAKLYTSVRAPSDTGVCTITDYRPNVGRDSQMLDRIRERYTKRYIWLQGSKDFAYTKQLNISGFELIDPTLSAYDEVLSKPCEFFGTRLHAGIRAMQFGRYARIVAVDNRAIEKGKDFGVPVMADPTRESFETEFLTHRRLSLKIPREAANKWKAQFASFLS